MSDLVSIVIPTYKRSKMLARAIKSALRQNYQPLEVIVVDDNGDNDENSWYVRDIVSRFDDPRLRLVKDRLNLGGAEARNAGIRESHGKYVAFLDDDDEYLPDKVRFSVARFEQSADPKLAVVYAFAKSVHEDGSTYLNTGDAEGWCPDKLLESRGLAATTQLVCKKSALEAVNGFARVSAKQDSMLLLRLFAAGYTIACVRQPLSLYYEHSGVRISSSGKTIEGEKALQKAGAELFYEDFDGTTIKKIESAYHVRLAVLYYMARDQSMYVNERREAVALGGLSALRKICIPVLRIKKNRFIAAGAGKKKEL